MLHNEHENEYYDHIGRYKAAHPEDNKPFRPWPGFEQWCGRSVPLGATLRRRLTSEHYAIGSGGDDMSRHESNVRAMQATTTTPPNERGLADETMSSDHTHDAAKSFNVGKKTLVWNVATGWLKVLVYILVATASSSAFLHAAECLRHRKDFDPKAHYTDTWPNDIDMWTALFPWTRGRLDVFHYMKRISDTLRPAHENYNESLSALSRCIFQFNEEDVMAVKRALRDGSLNGKKHSEGDIAELQRSGVFKKRYSKYIESATFSAPTIYEKVVVWAQEYPLKIDSKTNDTLGTRGTDDAVANALKHCDDLPDTLEHNHTLKPLPKQKHSLREKISTRGAVTCRSESDFF